MESSDTYIGNELELFSKAINWKGYYSSQLKKFITGSVLEAGAGIGETTPYLINEKIISWTCLEPDAILAGRIIDKISKKELPPSVKVIKGTTEDISSGIEFDTILYIDVIEHIQNDSAELERAKQLLRPGGHLIVLVPAHPFLFSPFDEAIGHYRRYNKKMLKSAAPAGFEQQMLRYLDGLGLFASLANKYILRHSYPSEAQIRLWDKRIVPVSKLLDPLLGFNFGKTLIGVWKK